MKDMPVCKHCGHCADNLCDFPVGEGKTCDAALCSEHSHAVGVELHYCPAHMQVWEAYRTTGNIEPTLDNAIESRETLYRNNLLLIESGKNG